MLPTVTCDEVESIDVPLYHMSIFGVKTVELVPPEAMGTVFSEIAPPDPI